MRLMNRKYRRIWAIFAIALVLFSLFTPLTVYHAEGTEAPALNTIEEDMKLEKELEASEKNTEEDSSNKQLEVTSEDGLPRLHDGLEIDKPSYDSSSTNTAEQTDKNAIDNQANQIVMEGKVEQKIYQSLKEEEKVSVIIHMKDDTTSAKNVLADAEKKTSREERLQHVQNQLQRIAETSQSAVLRQLDSFSQKGQAEEIKPLWIINGIATRVTKEALEELAKRDDVEKILLEKVFEVPEVTVSDTAPRLPEWGLEKVNATDVWSRYGIDGNGVVVGIMDTGVDVTHEALAANYRGRDGDHQYSWADFSGDGYQTPGDGNGHGTHVAGTAVGGGEGEPVGVAPGAEWIAAKIFNDSGFATESGIHQAFQWFMAPGGDPAKAPQVVNNSWGNPNTTDTTFQADVQAWVAAGIFPLFAAGNDGPASGSIGAPGSFPESFAVGATDSNDQIAYFSSRGPVYWENERIIKPDVSAPGYDIYSAWPGNGYHTISGTSMATPHVAGVIALILEANPELTIDEVKELLKNTARTELHMGDLPNDLYGNGIVNAYAAVTTAGFAGQVNGTVTDENGSPISATILIPEEDLKIVVPADGTFQFNLREGTHTITVESFGYGTEEFTVTVEKDQVLDVAWQLPKSDQYNIQGVVETTEGEPAVFAYVRVQNTPIGFVRTDENGEFTITGVPEGNYQLSVTGKGITSQTELVAVTADVSLDMTVAKNNPTSDELWKTGNNNNARNPLSNEDIAIDYLEPSWDIRVGGNVVFSSPVVNEDTVIIVTESGNVRAYDIETSEEKWSFRTGGMNRSTPTITDDYVYVAGGQDQKLYALDITSGVVHWSINTENFPVYESPIYEDGTLYVTSSFEELTKVSALNAEDGRELWSTTIPSSSYSGGALAGEQLIIGSVEDGKLQALSKQDGTLNWTFQVSGGGFASFPVVVENTVYAFSTDFDSNGTLWAVNVETGEELWHVDGIGDTQAASPVIYEDTVMVSSASVPSLKAFDRNSGELLWDNKNVNTTVNNGVVTSNGIYFVVDGTFSLKAVDVNSGELLDQWSLSGSSSSTPAISNGQIIVATQNGLERFLAPGILAGTIQDGAGNPVVGTVRIVGTELKTDTNSNGEFEMSLLPGSYDVRISSNGLEQVESQFVIQSGYRFNHTYQLNPVEQGQLTGTVVDSRSGKAVAGVQVTVQDTSLEATTDEEGVFEFPSIYAGNYDVLFDGSGYVKESQPVTISAGEQFALSVELNPIDVAVLNDYNATIVNLLNGNGIPAEERTWEDIQGEIENYSLLYLNGAYTSGGWTPSKAELDALLAEALVADVSVIFTDVWGPSYGSISDLVTHYQDPVSLESDFNDASISLKVSQDHPIFDDYSQGDEIPIMNSGKGSWFNGFSGRNLATVISGRLGNVGAGVAYKAVSENSAHLLLANNSTASWNLPTQHWLQPQHNVLVNSVQFLLDDAAFGKLTGQVTDQQGNPVQARVQVIETGVQVKADDHGQFELFHDEGTYELEVRLTGYETEIVEVTFENGQPITEAIQLTSSTDGKLSGIVTDAMSTNSVANVQVLLKNESEELVAETTTGTNGYYEFDALPAAIYTIEFNHDEYVLSQNVLELNGPPVEYNQALTPEPELAILGDKTYGYTLDMLFAEANIDTTNYTSIATLTEEIDAYDVVFFNNASGVTEASLKNLEQAADEQGVSIIYGDSYFSGGGIYALTNARKDPATRETVNVRTSAAQYVVREENPLFGELAAGETIDLLVPDGSRVSSFNDYSGYVLADIKHAGNETVHGAGVGFKPRTGDSMELLLSGHSAELAHDGEDYTDSGKQLFIDSVIWAAYEDFNVFRGSITNENGEAIEADVTLEMDGVEMTAETSPENPEFNIAALDGDATITLAAYGYVTQTFTITISDALEPMNLEMALQEDVGVLKGQITNQAQFSAIPEAYVKVVGYPREAYTDELGYYQIDDLEPGTYDVEISKDGFLEEKLTIEIGPGETKTYNTALRPSPTVGIVVDAQSASYGTVAAYLKEKGYNTVSMFYDDVEMLDEVDLVFANSDYNNDLIPDEETFKAFVKALDETETSVIWTGQHGGKGSIRYLYDYFGDPGVEYRGSGSGIQTATIVQDHPIFEGVPETFQFNGNSGYYYGFDDYTGTMLMDYEKEGVEEEGYMVGFKGRTINSVEILLGGMTFGYGYYPGQPAFDENREKIISNAVLWAIDHEGSYAGEIRGQVMNDLDAVIQAEITVEETGQTVETDNNGNFFVGLAEGSYTLMIAGFGHETKQFNVQVENGKILEQSFVLQSDAVGELSGIVRSSATGDVIAGAVVEVLGTPLKTETNENGTFQLVVPEGVYDVRVTASGFQPQTSSVTLIEGQTSSLTMTLADSQAIAVIATSANHGRLTPFLEENGYEVVEFDRNEHGLVKDRIEDFALVIFNDAATSMTEADFLALINAADEAQVSMIFPNQYGTGSINHLRDYLDDPGSTNTDFVTDSVEYEVLEEHPIFRGYNVGDQITILERKDSTQQYGVFDDYSGTTIADLRHVDEGRLGSGIAYDFRSSGHVHLLLSGLASSIYGSPGERWTDDARNIYINAVDWAIHASLGEISGVVQTEDGEPIEGATVRIPDENISVRTNDQGRFTIGVGTGEHTVSITAIGYEPVQETVVVENIGDAVELNVTLQASERMTIYGQVTTPNGEGLSDVTITATNQDEALEMTATSDSDGNYQLTELLAGEYVLTFEKDGYLTMTEAVTIENGQNVELNASISSYNIAVLGDFKGEISNVLQEKNLAAEQVNWNVLDNVNLYDVIIVNASDAEPADVEALVAASDQYQTSLVFLDTWGTTGSIPLLEGALGYPALHEQGYDEGEVFIQTDMTDHPIFEGFESGPIPILAAKSPYATFTDYRGMTLGNLAVDEADKGSSIAYTFRSNEHMHLLLSAFAVNNMVGPTRGWTEEGKQLFAQAVEWAKDATGQLPSAPVWKKESDEQRDGAPIVIGGTADPSTTIRIYDGDTLVIETKTNPGGVFNEKLYLPQGEYQLVAEAVNEDGFTQSETEMTINIRPRNNIMTKE
ncbi:carboxypeptidase regulatory-like domain-containing protein [Ornithinibacillus contaminans]|uniref:carboxypeptidase regulatory-like domain-containing protein n=1 Tax=Ornithinibacillus contaminans TaxID=694055 RepID=UPI00064DF69B|nr:carboxypeptidase regulatory-like domain-containing protein [Ornithinibacillus contaminans]